MTTILSRRRQVLKVTTTTWVRDSHDLFDYETRHVDTKTFYISSPMKAFRKNTDVTLIGENEPHPPDADYLVRFAIVDGKYQVAPAERASAQDAAPKKLWLIVKDLKKPGHLIQESDLIKLGRFKLKVKQCVKSGDAMPELRLDDGEVPDVSGTPDDEEVSQKQCRFCLLEGCKEDGPLIAPCQCKGSIKFIHVNCLCRWITGKLTSTSENSDVAFFYRQQSCELCKANFPARALYNGEKLAIVEVPPTNPPFLVLENAQHNQRGLHVISMANKNNLKLGRGHESDIRIADVSISRFHATIQWSNGNFVLEDYNSKFGTLVALRHAQYIEEGSPVSVQVGRTAVVLEIAPDPADLQGPLPTVRVDGDDERLHEGGGFDDAQSGGQPPSNPSGREARRGASPEGGRPGGASPGGSVPMLEAVNHATDDAVDDATPTPAAVEDDDDLAENHRNRCAFHPRFSPPVYPPFTETIAASDADDSDYESCAEVYESKGGLITPPTEAEDNDDDDIVSRDPRRRLSSLSLDGDDFLPSSSCPGPQLSNSSSKPSTFEMLHAVSESIKGERITVPSSGKSLHFTASCLPLRCSGQDDRNA